MADLATSDDLAAILQQDVEWNDTALAAAAFALSGASAIVRRYCRNPFEDEVPADVRYVTTRVASRIFKNPQGVSSYSYDGMAQQIPADMSGRVLTPDERMVLDQYRATAFTIRPQFEPDLPPIEELWRW